jgi:hypothetical protein
MPEYRAYSITGDNHIDQAAIVITADDDHQAIQLALPLVNGHDVEPEPSCPCPHWDNRWRRLSLAPLAPVRTAGAFAGGALSRAVLVPVRHRGARNE